MPTSTVQSATLKPRHILMSFSFCLLVALPSLFVFYYLFTKAQEQYVSTVAFMVRSEDVSAAVDILGGLNALGSGSSSDTDVLYEFVKSKALVKELDEQIDLRSLYSSRYEIDPWFSFDPIGTIEDLTEYWPSMVKIFYDQGTGLIEIQVRAFAASDARLIAEKIYITCSKLINDMSSIAREDSIKYADKELNLAYEQLRRARTKMIEFRSENKMVNPEAEISMHVGVISALQSQLSELLVEYDLISSSSQQSDPRLVEISKRIQIVENRILIEREKFTNFRGIQFSYSEMITNFESLSVDREYAEKTYLAALAAYDSAVREAQRQSRYLAAYVKPTEAEKSEHPKRWTLSCLFMAFSCLAWSLAMLFWYAVKDRR